MKRMIVILAMLPLAACSGGFGGGGGLFGGENRADPAPVEVLPAEAPLLDASSAEAAELGNGQFLGFSVVSLGDATVSGLWLETPLVSAEGPGRVVAENGMQLRVTLRPSGGERSAGSRMSLEAFQALGISLTALPTVTVISDA